MDARAHDPPDKKGVDEGSLMPIHCKFAYAVHSKPSRKEKGSTKSQDECLPDMRDTLGHRHKAIGLP